MREEKAEEVHGYNKKSPCGFSKVSGLELQPAVPVTHSVSVGKRWKLS